MDINKGSCEFSMEDRDRKDKMYRELDDIANYSRKKLPDEASSTPVQYSDEAAYMADEMRERDDIEFADLRAYSIKVNSIHNEKTIIADAIEIVESILNEPKKGHNYSHETSFWILEGRKPTGDGELHVFGDKKGIEQVNKLL